MSMITNIWPDAMFIQSAASCVSTMEDPFGADGSSIGGFAQIPKGSPLSVSSHEVSAAFALLADRHGDLMRRLAE